MPPASTFNTILTDRVSNLRHRFNHATIVIKSRTEASLMFEQGICTFNNTTQLYFI
jgi:hypothetical protein